MNKFIIKKKSGTYSELLETYGLANTLHKIFNAINESDVEIVISDKDLFYEVIVSKDITEEKINGLNYFWLFKYIKQKIDSDLTGISDYYDYPIQKTWREERNNAPQIAYRECASKDKKERDKRIDEVESTYETNKPIDVNYDVYSQISMKNNFIGFDKAYKNLFNNKTDFMILIKMILNYYCNDDNMTINGSNINIEKTIVAIQLYNPNQGKGLKVQKANSLSYTNFSCNWISETMKISGALSDMICQLVKVGSNYDLKVFVPEYKQVNYGFKEKLIPAFKKYLKGNTPIKIDVLNILLLTQKILENSEFSGRRKKVKDIVSGLHSVYQKDMGQNKAVINIGFIQVPNFIEIGNKSENMDWIEIIDEQKQIIESLDEDRGAAQGLIEYRNFISSSNIDSFFDFSFWYAVYLMNKLSKQYAKTFTIKSLNKLYKNMDTKNLKLMEIIENKGFQAVAKAIRESTVILQKQSKDARKYEIRYGMAQTVRIKSKSAEDLAAFIGDFISTYNAERARYAEKNGVSWMENVGEAELCEFFSLLDKYSSRLVGALLASYGFALQARTSTNQNDDENNLLDDIDEE